LRVTNGNNVNVSNVSLEFANVNLTYYICVHPVKMGIKFQRLYEHLLITQNDKRNLSQLKSEKKIHVEKLKMGLFMSRLQNLKTTKSRQTLFVKPQK